MKEQHYPVPPDLGQAFLILGMTVQEIGIVAFLGVIGFAALLHGCFYFLLAPVTCVMLFIRTVDGRTNLLSILTTRIGYFTSTQHYSLNPGRH